MRTRPRSSCPPARAHAGEGADEALEVLVGLHVAGEEDEAAAQLVALPHPRHLLLPRVLEELRVDRVRDHVDLGGVGPGVEAEDVGAGGLGDGEDEGAAAHGAAHHEPRVAEGHPAGQVLGEEQVDAVVDGDDGGHRAQEGADVVRRVEQLRPEPAQLQRDRDVLAQAVARGAVHHRHEVLREVAQGRLVGRVAEQEVRRLVVEAGEVADDVADVRPDAEVSPLADVDRDLQRVPGRQVQA
jgi:hypothetical protein